MNDANVDDLVTVGLVSTRTTRAKSCSDRRRKSCYWECLPAWMRVRHMHGMVQKLMFFKVEMQYWVQISYAFKVVTFLACLSSSSSRLTISAMTEMTKRVQAAAPRTHTLVSVRLGRAALSDPPDCTFPA